MNNPLPKSWFYML
ncbi:hypothetical protein L4D04_12855 [Photobacterium angustum]